MNDIRIYAITTYGRERLPYDKVDDAMKWAKEKNDGHPDGYPVIRIVREVRMEFDV